MSPPEEQRAKKLLQQCWMEICDLFEEHVREEDIDQYKKRYYETLTNQAIRIEKELGALASAKFLDQIGINRVRFSKARGNADYNNILMSMQRTKENLEELIKTEFWIRTHM